MKIITTYHYAYQNGLKLRKCDNSKCWQECEETVILMQSAAAAAAKLLQSYLTLMRPHRWPPTRLSHPWDSPGKNTGVSCHFRLQCMKVKSESEVAQSCPTPSLPLSNKWRVLTT